MSTVAEVMNQIKNDRIGSIYLILGKERYCSEEIKNALLGKLSPQEKEFNSSIYDMEETPLASALNDAMSVPFFGDRRIVIVNNPYFLTGEKKKNKVEHDIDGLLKYLEYPLETTTLVFIAPYEKLDERKKVVKTLKKVADVVENQPLKEMQVRQIINQRLKENSLSIEPKAFDTLMERTNAEISLAMNELDKLILLCKDEKVISEAEADRMISRSLEQNVFDLVALVLSRNNQKAIEMYHDLLLSTDCNQCDFNWAVQTAFASFHIKKAWFLPRKYYNCFKNPSLSCQIGFENRPKISTGRFKKCIPWFGKG